MEPLNVPGSLTAKYDPSTGVVRMFGAGLWQMSIVRKHFADLEAALAQARRYHPDVLVFCDLSTASVQMKEVGEEIEQFTERAYHPTDRIAVVLASSVLKMQMRRVVRQATFETFLSATAAYTWLTAHQIPRGQFSDANADPRQSRNAF